MESITETIEEFGWVRLFIFVFMGLAGMLFAGFGNLMFLIFFFFFGLVPLSIMMEFLFNKEL